MPLTPWPCSPGLMTDVETVDLELETPASTKCVARTDGTAREVVFFTDKPEEKGGSDRGPMSSELFAAAIASCHMTTAKKIADKRNVAFTALRCRAIVHFEGEDIERVQLRFRVSSAASTKDWQTVVRLAGRACTVGRAVKVPVEHEVEVAA